MMAKNNKPLFITGRFRSGTSFLWQLFNELNGFCAWYEPLHPQLLEAIKHVVPKKDHVGVSDYWQTYREKPGFKNFYSNRFATEQLYLDSLQRHQDLKTYITHLIELSKPDIPVLQFNRVDFRLPWLKTQFPDAVIIHIDRNPLQLYKSQRKHIKAQFRHQPDYWDAYELAQWSYALSNQLPFLTTEGASKHAFYRFYVLYQLSNIMAKAHADIRINLDVDVFQSDEFVKKISQYVKLNKQQKQTLLNRVNVPQLPDFDDAESAELVAIMTQVDLLLADSGLLENFGQKSMTALHFSHKDFWQRYQEHPSAVEQLHKMGQSMHKELVRLDNENKQMREVLKEVNSAAEHEIEQVEFDYAVQSLDITASIYAMLNVMSKLNGVMTQTLAVHKQLKSACQAAGLTHE